MGTISQEIIQLWTIYSTCLAIFIYPAYKLEIIKCLMAFIINFNNISIIGLSEKGMICEIIQL